MVASVILSLGAVVPSAPRAEAGTIWGKATAPAMLLRNVLRLRFFISDWLQGYYKYLCFKVTTGWLKIQGLGVLTLGVVVRTI